MRTVHRLMAVALLALPASLSANPKPKTAFDCEVGSGRAVILVDKARIAFRYTSYGQPDFVIVTQPGADDVHVLQMDYAGPELQLRFTSGTWSYILYSMEASKRSGSHAVSGIAILNGSKLIADRPCRNSAKMSGKIPNDILVDDESWGAMAL